VERRFRDGHSETWWAADLTLAGYEPGGYTRLVAATTDPATLPAASTWYVVTNLPHPQVAPATESALAPADLAELVRLYGLRQWVEQGYRQVRAIRRHWQLVCCAFSFCWWAYLRRHATLVVDQAPDTAPAPAARPAGEKDAPRGTARRCRGRWRCGRCRAGWTVDHALAVLVCLVERAPAARFASAA
jgi:hypothetical protein